MTPHESATVEGDCLVPGSDTSGVAPGWCAHALRVCHADGRGAHLLGLFLLLLSGGILGYIVLSMGPAVQWRSFHEVAVFLDEGWRIRNGQIPHGDYFSYQGGLYGGLLALGMWLTHDSVSALPVAAVIVAGVSGLWGWILASRRFSALATLVFVWLVLMAALAVLVPGEPSFKHTSYVGQYNWFGWSFLCLLAIQVMVPLTTPVTPAGRHLMAISVGTLLAILMSIKLNFMLGGFVLVLGGMILFGFRHMAPLTLLAAFLIFWALAWLLLGMRLDQYLLDLKAVMGSSQSTGLVLGTTIKIFVHNFDWFVVLLFMLLMGQSGTPRKFVLHQLGKEKIRLALAIFLVAGVDCFVASMVDMYSFITGELSIKARTLPLVGVATLMTWELLRRDCLSLTRDQQQIKVFPHLLAIGFGTYFIARIFLLPNILGIVYAFNWHTHEAAKQPAMARIQTESFATLLLPKKSYTQASNEYDYAATVRDGLALLKKHITPTSRILALDFHNSFPFALRLPPPRWGTFFYMILLWDDGQLRQTTRPNLHKSLDDVDLLMIPKWHDGFSAGIRERYAAKIAPHFKKIDESSLWTLHGSGLQTSVQKISADQPP
ncbi:MAG: hypothetical protein H7833_18400 [Magnetococcus sp. DMHC-1]